ncbi:MAG: hypothetical protein HY696_09960 [Deltaproteobacteria bacterium]|nr:hypothetical protein [Deltaproteobacteria bacterium]
MPNRYPSNFGGLLRGCGWLFVGLGMLGPLVFFTTAHRPDSWIVVTLSTTFTMGLGLLFGYAGRTAGLTIDQGMLTYRLFRTIVIPLAMVRRIELDLITIGRAGQQVLALWLTTEYARHKIHLESFERCDAFLTELRAGTGAPLEVSPAAAAYMQRRAMTGPGSTPQQNGRS